MKTRLLKFHSASKVGMIMPDNKVAWWFRNGVFTRGLRRDIQVGDLSASYENRFDDIKTLFPITKKEYIGE